MTRQLNFLFAFLLISVYISKAQNNQPTLLPIPADWRFEKIDFPLDFAPNLKYEGFEELRFAPGMFDTLSINYFTYIFALSVADETTFEKSEMELFLLNYYKGLCSAVAESKKLLVDISKIKVKVKKNKRAKEQKNLYTASINFFDSFSNGNEVILNMEIELFHNQTDKKLFLLALVSPHKKDSEVWKNLYEIRKKLKKRNPIFNI